MKKYLITILIFVCALFCTLGIAACVPQGLEAHNWSTEWSSTSTKHWRRCLDPGCNGRIDYEDHVWELTTVYEEPTCGDTGLGQYTCSVCQVTMGNANTPATVPATGIHDYKLDTVDVEPTCGEDGYGSYTCKVCYDYTVLPIPATGIHDYSGTYKAAEEGHYHVCGNGCGVNEEMQPHIKGEAITKQPSGTQDGSIEYRCTECNYLMDSEVIVNPNVLYRFDVKFIKVGDSENVVVPELKDNGELYVTLNASENANGGYQVVFEGYTIGGDPIDVPNTSFYHYDEFTAKKSILDLQHGGDSTTGYLGYTGYPGASGGKIYVARPVTDVSLWIESVPEGRQPVSLKVHIKAVAGTSTKSLGLNLPDFDEVTVYFQDNKNR